MKGYRNMKCLNCGKENENLLCPDCLTESVLEEIFEDVMSFNPETCTNVYERD